MKRFLADAILICILVALGSYINNQDVSGTQEVLNQKISEFEDDVALHKTITPKVKPVSLNEIDENMASRLAKTSSEFVVDTIQTSVGVISEIFHGLLK